MQANKPLLTDIDHSKKHSVEFIVIYAGYQISKIFGLFSDFKLLSKAV